jgi:hypothetical protein
MISIDPSTLRCPACESENITAGESSAFDMEIVHCESCTSVYHVHHERDGAVTLVAV